MENNHQHRHESDHHSLDNNRRHDDHQHGNPFLIPFILIFLFAFVEFYVGIWAKSLALLGDAWHMFSDVFALGLAMLASFQAEKKRAKTAEHQQTKFEIFASIINALLMFVVIVWIIKEAIARFYQPEIVASGYVMVVAFIGLVVNLIVAQRLHHQAHHHGGNDDLNHRAAFIHVLGDLLGSVAALAAGMVIYFTGWMPIDPILSIFIAILLLGVTLNLVKDIWLTCKQKNDAHDAHHHHH